jgi:hypothetical protein
MEATRGARWLRWMRGTATFVFIAALCLGVALLVIAFIPRSPVSLGLPASALSGLDAVGGVEPGVALDPAGTVAFTVTDPTLYQRLLFLATLLPGLLLVAEVARRMARLLRAAEETDPFTARTARDLTTVARLTAIAGVGAWAVSSIASSLLSATMLTTGTPVTPYGSPFGWLAVALIFAGFAQLISRGVGMRAELDTLI